MHLSNVIESLNESVAFLNQPAQLVVVINNVTTADLQLIEKDLGNYHFESTLLFSNATNLSEVLNYGLNHCRYELVARMDQDDISLKSRFQSQIAFLTRFPKVALVGGQVILINENGTRIGQAMYPVKPSKILKQLRYSNTFTHPAVMFRKNRVLEIGGYRNDYPMAEDYYLWVRMSRVYDLANLNEYVLEYRVHEKQTSHNNYFLQLISTIQIIGLNFNLVTKKLDSELSLLQKTNNRFNLKSFFAIGVFKENREFKAIIALFILRNNFRKIWINSLSNLILFKIAIQAKPFFVLKQLGGFLLRRFGQLTL